MCSNSHHESLSTPGKYLCPVDVWQPPGDKQRPVPCVASDEDIQDVFTEGPTFDW